MQLRSIHICGIEITDQSYLTDTGVVAMIQIQCVDCWDERIHLRVNLIDTLQAINTILIPSDLIWGNWLWYLVPSWNEFGTKLKPLDWASNEVSSRDLMQQLPNWDQDGTKLLHKKTICLIQILVVTSKAISLEDMMQMIGYKNRTSFRRNYLDSLEQVEFVAKTIPGKRTSPGQEYRITERGKLFLAGNNLEL